MHVKPYLKLLMICLTLMSAGLCADEIEYVVSGVDDPIHTNVLNHVSAYRIGSGAKLNSRLRRKLVEDAKISALKAMRPYGYFQPLVNVEMLSVSPGKWKLSVMVKAGPPVLIEDLKLELTGAGSGYKPLLDWYTAFPLAKGKVLDQQAWDIAKQDALDLMELAGYLKAGFTRHIIRVNPQANTARLELVMETGPRAIMGTVTFKQDVLSDGVLDSLQRFQSGDAYNIRLLQKFRLDLWRSGYFEDVEVVERRDLTTTPPRVDLEVSFAPRKNNTYQSTLGFGTDTLARLQLMWSRHLLSPRGDNFDMRFGWQQNDNEFGFQANYRLPRKINPQQFWIASLGLVSETQTLDVSESGDLENRFSIARGTITDYSLRLGKTRARNLRGGVEQLFETAFVQILKDSRNLTPTGIVATESPGFATSGPFESLLKNTNYSAAIGMDWDWPEIRGSGFRTTGHHQRAWMLTSNKAWGSDDNFSQVYLSSSWNWLAGDHWKFLIRAEAGYSDAGTTSTIVPTGEVDLNVVVTDLPNLYRFRAGGSRSVRGYGFELLDSNGLGSNNILTASAEVEYHFHDDWSVAAFVDVGNAFNDWSKPDLKRGSGVGVRWYSIIGAVRLDFAQGWDLPGEPWRIHLTIGTPLL